MKGDDIAERLLTFAAAVVTRVGMLPASTAGRHVGSQLVRSATSAGANYEEARSAESRADFIHKILLAAKESRESRYWLDLARRANLLDDDVEPLRREAGELAAILAASAKTARATRV